MCININLFFSRDQRNCRQILKSCYKLMAWQKTNWISTELKSFRCCRNTPSGSSQVTGCRLICFYLFLFVLLIVRLIPRRLWSRGADRQQRGRWVDRHDSRSWLADKLQRRRGRHRILHLLRQSGATGTEEKEGALLQVFQEEKRIRQHYLQL